MKSLSFLELSTFANKTYKTHHVEFEELFTHLSNSRVNKYILEYLLFFLVHHDITVRQMALTIVIDKIKKLKNKKMRDVLFFLLLLGSGDKFCRYEAIEGLIYYPEKKEYILKLLEAVLLQDHDPLIRVQAIDVLLDFNDSSTIPLLEYALNDKDTLVRVYAAWGLGLLNSSTSTNKLICLQDKSRNMLIKAACWGALLLLTGDKQWYEKLINKKVFYHKDYHIPMQVIYYLSEAVEAAIIFPKEIVPHIKSYLRTEGRKAVVERMENFIKQYSGSG